MCNCWNMRSATDGEPVPGDLTARARIRDAAIACVARNGVAVPLRTIAAECGVSASLIVHHFGSRAGLRDHCDNYVLERIHTLKVAALGPAGAHVLREQIDHIEAYASLVGYVLRSLQAGGPIATGFLDRLVADTENYLADAVTAGTVTPSLDPAGRARALVELAVGALVLQLPGPGEPLDLDALPAWLRAYTDRMTLPLLELYTRPLLTDSTLLDGYLTAGTPST